MDKIYQILKYCLITVLCSIELQMYNIDIISFFFLLICIILQMNSSEILPSACFKGIISF